MASNRFCLTIRGTPKHIRTLRVQDGERLLFAVVEANEKMATAFEGTALDDAIVAATINLRRPLTPSSAEDFASHLGAVIFDRFRKDIGYVLYAGVVLHDRGIDVCTAGDIRVHLVEHGQVVEVTRDHDAITDDLRGQYQALNAPREFLQEVATRALPATNTRPVECRTWKAPAGAQILICSSGIHRRRDPQDYVSELLNADSDHSLGFVATISICRA